MSIEPKIGCVNHDCARCQAEKQERFFCERCGKRLSGGIHTCTPPAETEEQEPVAWLVEFENGEQELHFEQQAVGETISPLYTHPPKRKWVGLTDDERKNIRFQFNGVEQIQLNTEAKLKEKNHVS